MNASPNTAGLRQHKAQRETDEHSRSLSLPCLACTGEGRLHSCEDFPINRAARVILVAFNEHLRYPGAHIRIGTRVAYPEAFMSSAVEWSRTPEGSAV